MTAIEAIMSAKNLHACCVLLQPACSMPHQIKKKRQNKRRREEEEEKKKTPDKTVESIVVPCVGINKLEQNEHSQEKALV